MNLIAQCGVSVALTDRLGLVGRCLQDAGLGAPSILTAAVALSISTATSLSVGVLFNLASSVTRTA